MEGEEVASNNMCVAASDVENGRRYQTVATNGAPSVILACWAREVTKQEDLR